MVHASSATAGDPGVLSAEAAGRTLKSCRSKRQQRQPGTGGSTLSRAAGLQRNAKALKGLYRKALGVKSAIPHPRILGVIRECGGKMHMHQRTWEEAATDFFEVRSAAGLPAQGVQDTMVHTCWACSLTGHRAMLGPCTGTLSYVSGRAGCCLRIRRGTAPPADPACTAPVGWLAGVQELRRGGRPQTDTLPQVPGARVHAHGQPGQAQRGLVTCSAQHPGCTQQSPLSARAPCQGAVLGRVQLGVGPLC